MVFETYSQEETENLARQVSANAKPGDIFCLEGGLGAGKTVFAKGFAHGMGILEEITSPTFAIVNVYQGGLALYHFDVYRIKHISEMEDTGYEEYFYGGGVCLIEWAGLIKGIIPGNATWVSILRDYNKEDDYRKVIIGVRP
ncbi:MAG: tRNA (adenosine(37)-N6)-threonylcarbamoyltransferase complex ATPase subunit type 1 TsaE [Clostridiales bacterium]|jgi:tRNA threonylcarbamoyladenosine biosynthesis protein TsaE|nr:tRNA (adenosine(37)-N6)-threonylcarbamoyltransferase complex ATPase subunit type 1 TsaE [Clostridiales bacterium]